MKKENHILGHKINLNKLKIIFIIQNLFPQWRQPKIWERKNNKKIFKHLETKQHTSK